ncbi:alpha/beta hydrolase [uncultured Formosa sp.]|uniref:alpha/beta hydrolase n=1 Tax=uncultured Formosa sp. TaxID=255435 RepID=UPI00262B81EE|nr:alpha/beta hydrolase [uncultured Formosa sp.]
MMYINRTYFSNFKPASLTLMMLLFLSMVQAQTRDTIYLWTNTVPGENEAKHAPVQSDNTKGNVVRLTNVTNPALVVFKPEKQNDSGVGIIICPGGGYDILAIDKEGYEIAEWLNKLGYTAFVLQYRVPKKQKGALNDIQRAIRIIRSNSLKYNLNNEKIGVLGFSAGGSLCARASTMFTLDTYEKSDHIDTLSSRPNFAMLIYPAYLDKGKNRNITPELQITKETPPFFIFGTADDNYSNSTLVMTTALRDNKIPVELHLLPKGGHGYGKRSGNIAAETWPNLAKEWLKKR